MDDKYYFVTTSGTTVCASPIYSGSVENRDAVQNSFNVATPTGPPVKVNVIFPTPPILTDALEKEAGLSFNSAREDLAVLTLLSEVDNSPNLFEDPESSHEILADASFLLDKLKRSKMPDRDMRRYIIRKVYEQYSRTTLSDPVSIQQMDFWITGAAYIDFLRNIEVLAEEGYLRVIEMSEEKGLAVRGTARLVREFEKYGAARDDVIAQQDYVATLGNYPVLQRHSEEILLEHRRYTTAITPSELISVFRAVAPIVETILRELLSAHGCTKHLQSLGPMISELQRRTLGSVALYSQLNHILKFSRDLAQHGAHVSEPVLRIACENAFELIPQLATLFP